MLVLIIEDLQHFLLLIMKLNVGGCNPSNYFALTEFQLVHPIIHCRDWNVMFLKIFQ